MMVCQVYPAAVTDLACRGSCTGPRGRRSGSTGDIRIDDGSEEIREVGMICDETVCLERIENG